MSVYHGLDVRVRTAALEGSAVVRQDRTKRSEVRVEMRPDWNPGGHLETPGRPADIGSVGAGTRGSWPGLLGSWQCPDLVSGQEMVVCPGTAVWGQAHELRKAAVRARALAAVLLGPDALAGRLSQARLCLACGSGEESLRLERTLLCAQPATDVTQAGQQQSDTVSSFTRACSLPPTHQHCSVKFPTCEPGADILIRLLRLAEPPDPQRNHEQRHVLCPKLHQLPRTMSC